MLSVNQKAAHIKLVEMCKAKHMEVYPIIIRFKITVESGKTTHGETKGKAMKQEKQAKQKHLS